MNWIPTDSPQRPPTNGHPNHYVSTLFWTVNGKMMVLSPVETLWKWTVEKYSLTHWAVPEGPTSNADKHELSI